MTEKERAELLRLVEDLCNLGRHDEAKEFAKRIVDEIAATGWNITQPLGIKPKNTRNTH